jgi:hypothetical protein
MYWACSMDMDTPHVLGMEHGHERAAWTCHAACLCQILHVQVHFAWPCQCRMYKSVLHGLEHAVFTGMQHGRGIKHGQRHAADTWHAE